MSDDRLLRRINRFLDANYPCTCDDAECPGNVYEAIEIVELVRSYLTAVVPRYWGTDPGFELSPTRRARRRRRR
jgi:hypothetical protein